MPIQLLNGMGGLQPCPHTRQTPSSTYHVLLSNVTLNETVRVLLFEEF